MAEIYKSVVVFYDAKVGDKLKEIVIDIEFTNKELAQQSTKNWVNFYTRSLNNPKYKIVGKLKTLKD